MPKPTTARIIPTKVVYPPPVKLLRSSPRKFPSLNKASSVNTKADFVFVIDATGSMSGYINGVKSAVTAFSEELTSNDVDVRFSIVEYRDVTCSEVTKIHTFSGGGVWTVSADEVVNALATIHATGGGDGPETPTEAIMKFFSTAGAYGSPFRTDASRFVFLLTDADAKTSGEYGYYSGIPSMSEAAARLKLNKVHTVVVSRPDYEEHYKPLWGAYTGGRFISIYDDYYATMLDVAGLIYEVSGLTVGVFERGRKTDDVTTLNPPSANTIAYINDAGKYVVHTGAEISERTIANLGDEYSKKGYTADGNTRLIIRVQNSKPGQVQFSVDEKYGTLETLDRTQSGSSLSVGTTRIGGSMYQASVVLIAPESFPYSEEENNFPEDSFNVGVTFTGDDGTITITKGTELIIYATPVVLIHGIYGNIADTFGVGEGEGIYHQLHDVGKMHVRGWDYGGLAGPTKLIRNTILMNSSGLFIEIAKAMGDMITNDIACTRVDLVCHSMGGLMARTFMLAEDMMSERSYKQSMVRRVVTVATPHEGSPMTTYLLGNAGNLPYIAAVKAGTKTPDVDHAYVVGVLESSRVLTRVREVVRDRLGEGEDAVPAWTDLALDSEIVSILRSTPSPRPIRVIYGTIRNNLRGIFGIVSNPAVRTYISVMLRDINAILKTVPGLLEDYGKFYALFDVMFNEDDYDVAVGKASAVSRFSGYTTEYGSSETNGGLEYNHLVICKQDIVGEEVLSLLRGNDDKFDKSGVGSPSLTSSLPTLRLTASLPSLMGDSPEPDDDYFVNALPLTAEISGTGTFTAPDTITVTPPASIKFTVASDEPILHNVYVSFNTGSGGGFALMASKDEDLKEFTLSLDVASRDTGIIELHCFSQGNEDNLYISDTFKLIIQPNLELTGDNVSTIAFLNPGLVSITNTSSEVGISLFAQTEQGRMLDIAAPAMGTSWTADDPEIAEVTEAGRIRGKKSGSTVLRANYNGFTAAVSVDVAVQYDASDTPEPQSKDLFITTSSLPEGKAGEGYSLSLIHI